MNKSSSFNFTKFYFTIVSIGSIVGMVVAFGIALYSGIIGTIISDDEYILSNRSREIKECSQPMYADKAEEQKAKTPEEIADCEAKATKSALAQRSIHKKESITGGLIRGILFAILFVTHFPRMRKAD